MKQIEIISSEKAPEAIGPYSQAVRAGDLVFCSGQIGIDRSTGSLVSPDIRQQTEQALINLREILISAGLNFNHVVKTTIYLSDIKHFSDVNTIYSGHFKANKPARATIEVAGLPLNALVEIDCIAFDTGKTSHAKS